MTATERKHVNPIIVLMGILFLAMGLTFLVDSGSYERDGRLVIPGSYQTLEKDRSISNLFAVGEQAADGKVRPVSFVGTLMTIPVGLERMAGLIFMVLIIGGWAAYAVTCTYWCPH